MAVHENKLLRHTVKFRPLQVLRTEEISPCMRRVIVGGPALEGFDSPSPDDHVKLFFPNADGQFVVPTMTPEGPRYPEGQQPSPARDYTPRWWDLEAGELALDFVMHGHGVASSWAANAQPGDAIAVGGPRGSHMTADVYIEIPESGDRQELPDDDRIRVSWLERNGFDAASSTLLEDVLTDFEEPDGDTFYWIATESRRARMMRKYIEGHLGVPKDWIRSTGYWKAHADEHDGD
jgi:NADPH-dependent ferric siderophore reductase